MTARSSGLVVTTLSDLEIRMTRTFNATRRMIEAGMEGGASETYDRLAEYLRELKEGRR